MAPTQPVNIILGTHTIGDSSLGPGIIHFDTEQDVKALLDAFYNRGYRQLDSAHDYPGSEVRLGQAGAPSRFTIHTKVHSGAGEHEPANIAKSIARSLEALKVPSVETMFLHVPDRETPFEDTARAMNDAFKQGKFKHFGLSNYTAAEVQQFIDICEAKAYVKPSVYEGHYNTIVRGGEKELFPLLRKHGIAFFAYSPAAGGIFTGQAGVSSARWSDDNLIGKIYSAHYGAPAIKAAVDNVRSLAEKHGISGHAAGVRWTAFHSVLDGKYGDAVIFGVSKMTQLHQTLDALEAGALPEELVEAMSAVYATLGDSAPGYHL